jgi:hypothetical protein
MTKRGGQDVGSSSGICVKAAAAAVSDTVQQLNQHHTFGLQSDSHLVVAWGRGDESM